MWCYIVIAVGIVKSFISIVYLKMVYGLKADVCMAESNVKKGFRSLASCVLKFIRSSLKRFEKA